MPRSPRFAFVPVVELGTKRDLAAVNVDRKVLGIESGDTLQRCFDLLAYFERIDRRLDLDLARPSGRSRRMRDAAPRSSILSSAQMLPPNSFTSISSATALTPLTRVAAALAALFPNSSVHAAQGEDAFV